MLTLDLSALMDYTDWERQKWHSWLKQHGDDVLKINAGPNGDGRFSTVGDIIKHIFSAESRYIDRLSDRPLTDPASIPNDNSEALFQFGAQTRSALKKFIDSLPTADWDTFREFDFFNGILRATPKKIVTHVLLHEIRHWAQIATLLRLNGLKDELPISSSRPSSAAKSAAWPPNLESCAHQYPLSPTYSRRLAPACRRQARSIHLR